MIMVVAIGEKQQLSESQCAEVLTHRLSAK